MSWVRVDDAFYDHRKFAEAGPLGIALWLAGLAYCNRNRTNGKIPKSRAHGLLDWSGLGWKMWMGELIGGGEDVNGEDVARHLIECGLWEENGRAYLVHDYLDYQPSREQIEAATVTLSEKRAAAGRKGAAAANAKRQTVGNRGGK